MQWFWSVSAAFALIWAGSAFVALALNHWSVPSWTAGTLLANMRFGIMPFTALALLTGAHFALLPRHRWTMAAAATCDGAFFIVIVVAKFVLV